MNHAVQKPKHCITIKLKNYLIPPTNRTIIYQMKLKFAALQRIKMKIGIALLVKMN